ncbi:MAG: hypothetical protein K2K64_11145, partial [Muribaculaceae bacterium]|nr:hypothetical protein [Muribaculaceae bacterium]
MTDKNQTRHDKIKSLLFKGRLNDSFRLLRKLLTLQSDSALTDRLNHNEQTYKYMIHYLVEGYPDDGREGMISDIISDLHHINDMILRNAVLPASEDIYSSALRFENIRKATLQGRLKDYFDSYPKSELARIAGGDRETERSTETALESVFTYVWTMFGAPAEEYKELTKLVKSEEVPFQFKAQVISALLLGNLRYFDREALISLIDIYEAEISPKISARALVAIFLIVAANHERVQDDYRLRSRLSLWKDDIMAYPRLREVLMNILRARDTERINKKVQDELLPEIMKMRPEIISKLKNATEEMDVDSLEENPEWEELLNKNGIGDKLKELTEIQLDGGDVMMMAFSNLKSFPFFNNVANWFLPFSSNHSEVATDKDGALEGFAEILDMEGVMCDSDKFSFALSLNRMPSEQKKIMSQRMGMEMPQITEMMEEKKLVPGSSDFDLEVTRYLRNIYRFFKLFRRKGDFRDPFESPIDFRSLPYLSELLSDSDILNLVSEFYFKRGYYKEALPLFLSLEKMGGDASLLWEKIGYCHNALNNLNEALVWYRKAELINPDSQWLIKKIALVSRLLNRPEEATEYYLKALEKDPDNFKLLISTGNCLLEAGLPGDALKHYYHAAYLQPTRLSAKRAIAWGELLNRNYQKSLDTYSELFSSGESTFNAHLNAGHAALLMGRLKDAS